MQWVLEVLRVGLIVFLVFLTVVACVGGILAPLLRESLDENI